MNTPEIFELAMGIRKLALSDIRSSSLRNLAVSGKSWIIQYEKKAAKIVASPSRIKTHAQPRPPLEQY